MSDQAGATGAAGTGASAAVSDGANTGAGTNGAGGSSQSGAGTQGTADWTQGLDADLKGFVQNKGFTDAKSVLESYRNFEKLQGVPQDRLLKLPENMDTPEGRAIWEKLGRPKDAKDYTINIPKENGDPKMADWLRGVADKSNMTQKQVETLANSWNERTAGDVKAYNDKMAASEQAQEQALKTSWGGAFDQNLNIARSAVKVMGWTKEQVDSIQNGIGYDGVMKLLHQIGSATGEHAFVSGRQVGSDNMSADQAKAKITEMISDSGFRARLMSKDADAVRQWDAANKQAYPGMMSL